MNMNNLGIKALAAGFLIVLIGVLLLSGLSGLEHAAAPNLIGMASVIGGGIVVIFGIDRLVKESDAKEASAKEEDADSD